ncbi:MAG: cytochrome P460 family protein [Janthinobacterium lividum]
MRRILLMAIVCSAAALSAGHFSTRPVQAAQAETPNAPPATMPIPANYREWIFLTSGLDMTYAAPGAVGLTAEHHSVFDNVFVNPEAYHTFLKTGNWPDSTTFVLENRAGESDVSINKAGKTQGQEISGLEVHAKLHGEWAFYVRAKEGNERLVPRPASCYTCHEEHAAVDTTFVQFYPTLLPLAKEKHLLSAAFLLDPASKPAEK